MSNPVARTQSSRATRPVPDTRAEQMSLAVESSSDTPYRLLWSTGIIAFVLSVVAFLLWGIDGPSTLFDMMAALCT
jgi:hypothetical protein